MKLTQKILNLLVILFVFNSKGSEGIVKAIISGKPGNEIIPLIEAATVDELNRQVCRGQLALVCASNERNYEAMKAMLEAGADVNLADVWGWTPLRKLLGSYKGLNERPQLQLLLDYGADWSDIHYGTLRPGLQKFFKNYAKKKSEQQQEDVKGEADERHTSQLDSSKEQERISQIQLQKVKDGAHALREEWVQLKTDTVELHQHTTSDIDATKEQVREASARLMHALGIAEQERDSKQVQLDRANQEIERLSGILSSGSQSSSITYHVNHDHSQHYNNQDNKQCCSNIWCKLLCCFRCCKRCEQPCRESKFNGCSLCSV